jgi:hypothetical protein
LDFFGRFIGHLESRYPKTASSLDLKERLSPHIFCPDVISLPASFKSQAEEIVKAFWALRNLPLRTSRLEAMAPPVIAPGNSSILMSYDFHTDDQGQLRLIEINTNASMGLMVHSMHELWNEPNAFSPDFGQEIVASIRREFHSAYPGGRKLQRAVIIDETPDRQRMFPEFHMYRELLESEGIETFIADSKELRLVGDELQLPSGERVDFVYNRDTDFYLETPERATLQKAMLTKAACFSPHPHEYRLLADKDRLLELSRPGALDELDLDEQTKAVISRTLIRTLNVTEFRDHEELWQQRKKWFFKPSRSYGGKAAYRGSSIGRTVFAQIVANPYLAQEYVPAANIRLPSAPEDGDFKYDLRFFVYEDKIQIACARAYKGQMTNSQTPGGGVAVIRWTD